MIHAQFGFRRLPPLVLAALVVWIPAAHAQSGDLSGRMDRLEGDMRQLQQDYYASSGQGAQGNANAGMSPDMADRLNALEQSVRDLRGQVEESGFRQRQIQERLDGIEQKLGVPPAPAASPTPAPGTSGSAAPAGPQPLASADAPPPSGTPGTLGTLSASALPEADEAATPTPTDEKGQFDAAIATLYQGNRAGGVKALQSFIKAHPKSKHVPQAYYWMGEAELADKSYKDAGDAFLTVVTKYPKDPVAPKSLVKLGSTLIAGGQAKEGCKQLKSIKQVFPKADQTVVDMAARERKLGNCA